MERNIKLDPGKVYCKNESSEMVELRGVSVTGLKEADNYGESEITAGEVYNYDIFQMNAPWTPIYRQRTT